MLVLKIEKDCARMFCYENTTGPYPPVTYYYYYYYYRLLLTTYYYYYCYC